METPNQPNVSQDADILSKARANKKSIIGLSVALLAIVIIVLGWMLYSQHGSQKAAELVGRADMAADDSVAVELYKQAADAGYKGGDRAKMELAIRAYRQGNYEEAINYLDGASASDEIVAAGIESLKGDCYANLGDLDKALKCYRSALSECNGNPAIAPIMLVKQANVCRANGDYKAEAEAYKTILDEYPTYASQQTDIRKYYERALAQAAE